MREPFAQIPLVHVGGLGELGGGHGAVGKKRLVEAERVTQAHHGDARCAAQIAQHLADESVEFSFVNHCDLRMNKIVLKSSRKLQPRGSVNH
jgi:hypothetical protein